MLKGHDLNVTHFNKNRIREQLDDMTTPVSEIFVAYYHYNQCTGHLCNIIMASSLTLMCYSFEFFSLKFVLVQDLILVEQNLQATELLWQ